MTERILPLIVQFVTQVIGTLGYAGIVALMGVESACIPLPSEIIMPFAGYLVYTGHFSLFWAATAGAIGCNVGSVIAYWVGAAGGRPLVLRYGRYLLVSPQKVVGAERWASHYGSMGIFISRLLPVVRHLIGIPAGILRMNYRLFSAYTVLGSSLWCAVLCYVGVKMGQDEKLMKGEAHRVSVWVGGAVLVLGGTYYFFVHRQMKKAKALPQNLNP